MAKSGTVQKTEKIQKQMERQHKPKPVKARAMRPMRKTGRGR